MNRILAIHTALMLVHPVVDHLKKLSALIVNKAAK